MSKRIIAVLLVISLLLSLFAGCGKKKEEEAPAGPAAEDTVPDKEAETPEEEPEPLADYDFSTYEQQYMDDLVREVSSKDRVRNKDYVVDDIKLEKVIDTLDFALGSNELKSLANLDLHKTLDDLVSKIYTNDIINLAVQYLYPLVEKEFAKVWSGLPESIDMDDVSTGVPVAKTARVNAALHIMDIEQSMEAIQFYLFPTTLAKQLPEQYSKVAEKLSQATSKSRWDPETETMYTPWEDEVLLTEDGKLDLDWGVHDRESFIDAISAALYGVEPLLLALIANKKCDNTGKIGTGDGHAMLLKDKIKLKMTIDTIDLNLTATANPGYNNVLVPIFEALDLTAPDGNTFESLRDVVEKGLVEPIEQLVDRVSDAPVTFILRALPNIARAIESQLIVPLLSMLRTEINYTTNAYYTVQIIGEKIAINGSMNDAYKSDEPIKINVGEMIDLSSMGIDLSSLNGLLALAEDPLGVKLPEIDGEKLASLGTLVWRDTVRDAATYKQLEEGKAAYIKANRGDVLQFLLEYVFNGLKEDETLLPTIMEKVGNGAELPAMVTDILNTALESPADVLAAITELIVPQQYDEPASVKWKNVGPAANNAASLYNDFWTHEKAGYMTSHLPTLIDGVLGMVAPEIAGVKATSLKQLLNGLIGSLIKASTLNDLAKKLSDTLSGVDLPEGVGDLLKNSLGIDLNYWDGYNASFPDGDRAGFKSALAELLKPAESLLTFLLSDQDLSVKLSKDGGKTSELVTLSGYDGYAYALIPLLEALGAKNLPSPDVFKADPSRTVSHIVDALFSIIDGLLADPYGKLVTLIPNLLAFLRFGGLTSAIDNLMYPINLLLDIIRPVFDFDITSLLDFDIRFEKTDPIKLLSTFLSDTLKDSLGVRVTFDFTTQKLYNALNTGKVESFVSANGKKAYRINAASINKEDMLTVVYDFLLKELLCSKNTPAYLALIKDKLGVDEKIFSYIEKIVPAIGEAETKYPGSSKALVFWVLFIFESYLGAKVDAGEDADTLKIVLKMIGNNDAEKTKFATSELAKDLTNPGFAKAFGIILKPLLSK